MSFAGCLQVPEIPTSFAGYRHHGAWVHIASEALGRSAAARLISGGACRIRFIMHPASALQS